MAKPHRFETKGAVSRLLRSEAGVGDTSSFFLLTLAATVICGVVVAANRSPSRAEGMARGFFLLAVALSLAALVLVLAGTSGLVPENAAYARWLRLLLFRGWLVIGMGVSSALLALLSYVPGTRQTVGREAVRSFLASPYLLKGLCFSVSVSFFCVEIGKLSHDADMRQFFLQSGYSVAFMYFVMLAETAGAVGLFFPRTTLPAALGLIVLMMGAIRTHVHNRDPFSDSIEAVHLLILLACIIVVRVLGGRMSPLRGSRSENVTRPRAHAHG